MASIVVGITGKFHSGKTTIAEVLAKEFGFSILMFSEPLKEEILARLPRTLQAMHWLNYGHPATPVQLRDLVYRTKPAGVRELLQEYGTEVRRADDLDYWVRKWQTEVALIGASRVVAPDMRFVNEYYAIHDMGGITARVSRPGYVGNGHASENDLDKVPTDCQIVNKGTKEELEEEVRAWAKTQGW